MLDDKSLALLQTLKTDIKASKTVYEGTVKGTGKKFGFVINCEDNSEHFLPPDDMSRVFPGDRVTFTVVEQDDGKTKAELEELVQSDLNEFNGVFCQRGKGQGVEPFDSAFSGWLFVPPKKAGETKHNDLVRARVIKHPWEKGKAQAEIITCLGSADNNRSWYSIALADQGIPERFSEAELQAAAESMEPDATITANYRDLTDVPFITIDSETTQDMDDALFAEANDDGWLLLVAIADASAFIKPDSPLDLAAQNRLTATYLPGLTLPMLPDELANNAISLVPDQNRPAMIFRMQITPEGNVAELQIETAFIRSRAKLSYDNVAEWLDSGNIPDSHADNLQSLKAATDALANWRADHANQMNDRADYRIRVDEEFNVTAIDTEHKNSARGLVEEAMVATNHQAALWLKDKPALFMAHRGFKADRETELKGLLRDFAPTVADCDGHNLTDFRRIISAAQQVEFPLFSVLQKRFDRGYWTNTAEPHFGLGLSCYTNVTSPIRKYSDLCMHRLIRAVLQSAPMPELNKVSELLNSRGNVSRFASQKIENRLRNQWLAEQPEQVYEGTVVHMNANNLMVRLNENGAVGQVDMRKVKDQFSYDPLRMRLKFEDYHYQLEQPLKVQIANVTPEQLKLTIISDE